MTNLKNGIKTLRDTGEDSRTYLGSTQSKGRSHLSAPVVCTKIIAISTLGRVGFGLAPDTLLQAVFLLDTTMGVVTHRSLRWQGLRLERSCLGRGSLLANTQPATQLSVLELQCPAISRLAS